MTAFDAPSPAAGGHPPIGGLADEAAQLLDTFAARLALIRLTVGDQERGDREPVDREPGDHEPEVVPPGRADPVAAATSEPAGSHRQCVGWCPVCRSADLLRGERPEVAGKLVDSAIVVVTALRSLFPPAPGRDQPSPDQPAADPSRDQPTTEQTAPDQPAPGIERIDIR